MFGLGGIGPSASSGWFDKLITNGESLRRAIDSLRPNGRRVRGESFLSRESRNPKSRGKGTMLFENGLWIPAQGRNDGGYRVSPFGILG